jgi:hypothetical protein
MDSNRQSSERAISPAPPSRIPKFSSKLGANYKRVQEKMEKAANERQEKGQKLRGKRHKLSLTPATSHSVIPSRWPELPHTGNPPSGLPHNGYTRNGLPPSGYQQSGIPRNGYQAVQNPEKDLGNLSSSIPVHRSLIVQTKSQSLDKLRYQRHKSVPRDFVIQKVSGNFWERTLFCKTVILENRFWNCHMAGIIPDTTSVRIVSNVTRVNPNANQRKVSKYSQNYSQQTKPESFQIDN